MPEKNDFLFNYTPTPENHAKVLGQELQKRNLKNVSLICVNHRGALLSIDEFKKIAPEYGINILDEQIVNVDMSDFGLLVPKMAAKNPDAYVAILIPPVLERWKVALDRQGIKTPVTSMNTMDFTSNKDLFEGHWYVSDSFIDSALSEKYRAKFGKEIIMNQGYYGYLGLDSLIDAYEKHEAKPTADVLAQDLLNMKKQDSVVGEISWSPNRLLSVTPIVKKIQNGQDVQIK